MRNHEERAAKHELEQTERVLKGTTGKGELVERRMLLPAARLWRVTRGKSSFCSITAGQSCGDGRRSAGQLSSRVCVRGNIVNDLYEKQWRRALAPVHFDCTYTSKTSGTAGGRRSEQTVTVLRPV